jgi:hypothetical protein
MQRDRARNVLVVGPDEDVRDQIGEWLEGADSRSPDVLVR